MPSSTPKQARTMAAAAHNPSFAKKVGIPTGVAKDFNKADSLARGLRRRSTGGTTMGTAIGGGAAGGGAGGGS